ncbi:MAG: response regulator [Anaerolineae bacterium]|nr:response regulator [Anaerolineae bacterium]
MPTWMVVEDEPDIYDVLLAMFEIWGIEGVAFVDGAEAVSWIDNVDQNRVRGELPELAILDIRLPEISGPDVGHRLRQSPVLGNMAIVLITAYRLSPEEEDEVIARAQADLLMYKPLPAMPELRQKMDDVIAKHKQPKTDKGADSPGGIGPVLRVSKPKPVHKPSPARPSEKRPMPKPLPEAKPDSSKPDASGR